MQLYLDMDGVLADFDSHHETVFGYRPVKDSRPGPNWDGIRAHEDFYGTMPMMQDAAKLLNVARSFNPIVLTGVYSSGPYAITQKHAWGLKHLGPDIKVQCCHGARKFEYCKPGDILIDDWEKYRHLWEKAGGRWITHISADQSISELIFMVYGGIGS